VSDLFSNATFSALVGVVIGGALSYVAATELARRQRRASHKAAVRAVLYELSENLPKVIEITAAGQLTTSAYDALLIPLYTDLPGDVAHHVSLAYAMLHVTGSGFKDLRAQEQEIVRDELQAAQQALKTYAERKFQMTFNPPALTEARPPSRP
jgi:hypothetical protein